MYQLHIIVPSFCFVLWSDCPFENSGIFATLTSWTLRGSPSSLLPNTGVHLPVGPGQGRNNRLFIKASGNEEYTSKIAHLIRDNINLMILSNGDTIMHNIITNSSKFKEENTLGPFLNLLIKSGINKNDRDSESHSPLFLAIDCNKSSETLDTLLNSGCHIDQTEEYPFPTPYIYLQHKYPQIIKKT